MSDDLVKRLRMVTGFIRFETGDRVAASACLSEEAADRIEELEAKLAVSYTRAQIEAAVKRALEEAATTYEEGFPVWDVFGGAIRAIRAIDPAHFIEGDKA